MAARTKKTEEVEEPKVEETVEVQAEEKVEEPEVVEPDVDDEAVVEVEDTPGVSDDYARADDFGIEYDDSGLRETLAETEKQVKDNLEKGVYNTNPGKDLKQI